MAVEVPRMKRFLEEERIERKEDGSTIRRRRVNGGSVHIEK